MLKSKPLQNKISGRLPIRRGSAFNKRQNPASNNNLTSRALGNQQISRNNQAMRINDPKGAHEQQADQFASQINNKTEPNPSTSEFKHQGNPLPSASGQINNSSGQALEPDLRNEMESRFNHNFSQVRIHNNAKSDRAAKALNAKAFTIGSNISFAARQYSPGTDAGKSLIAHELSHVLQASRHPDIIFRKPAEQECPATQQSGLNYNYLAQQINEGVEYIWGTDEEKIFTALLALEQDKGAVCKLKNTYLKQFNRSLIEDLQDDLDAQELSYAMELLGESGEEFEQRMQPVPITYSSYIAEAQRLFEAADIFGGTDEEAIFAVLTPLSGRPAMETLKQTYFKEYNHSIEYMINDEMSGSEREFALKLLNKPVNTEADDDSDTPQADSTSEQDPVIARLVQEAYRILENKGLRLAPWWDRKPDGSTRYDEKYWVFELEEEHRKRKARPQDLRLTLRPGVTPHKAITSLFEEQYKWEMDCGQFVQIARYYVQLKLLNDADRFNDWANSLPEFALRTHGSLDFRQALFVRAEEEDRALDIWEQYPKIRWDKISEERMLELAPAGSRIRWTNAWIRMAADIGQDHPPINVTRTSWFAFQHENAIKLGPDRYGAHGLGELPAHKIVEAMINSTRDMLKLMTGVRVNGERILDLPTNPSDEEIREHIYVSNIEYYKWDR